MIRLFSVFSLLCLFFSSFSLSLSPPDLSADFSLVQNATFFQFVPGADGWMMGTGWIKTESLFGFGLRTEWKCWGVLPAHGSVLTRADLNASFYLSNYTGNEPQSCVSIPFEPVSNPWSWLSSPSAQYAGPGQADCGATDTWSTALPANMTAVSICRSTGAVAYAAQFTSRYFSAGNVHVWNPNPPNKSVFALPRVCEESLQ